MGKREKYLKSLCNRTYGIGSYPKPTLSLIKGNGNYAEVLKVYRELGGLLEEPPFGLGSWDIETKDFIIELDEENHFNRYRLLTLDAPIYKGNKNFHIERYRKYCVTYEKKCPKSQRRWCTPSADRQFGVSSQNGDFSDNGPSRWKQRAFYDYLRVFYVKFQIFLGFFCFMRA